MQLIVRVCLLLLCIIGCRSEEVPAWVLRGIAKVETRSAYLVDGEIVYVDKRRGKHGEVGPFQMRRIAFMQVAPKDQQEGLFFFSMETDTAYALEMATKYILWLRKRHASWDRVVEAYNAGPRNRSPEYLKAVKAAGVKK